MEKDKLARRLFVIGGSAGSLTMVLKILPCLNLSDACVIIVFHRKQTEDAVLLDILANKTQYEVKEVEDKDPLNQGIIYVAPADYHVLIEKDCSMTLDDSEKVNYSRPSIDVTFESAAEAFGNRLVCFLLSGANADGVDGLVKAKNLGAKIIVQDPAAAEVPFMPQKGLDNVDADLILSELNIDRLTDL